MKKLFILLILILAPAAFAQSENIKIGVFADYTGQTSSFGISSFSGIKMAIEEINAEGGVLGRKLEIVIADDSGSREKTAAVVKNLISESKVIALIGEPTSDNAIIGASIAQSSQIPMITPSATNPKVTEVGDYIFRVCTTDTIQGAAMAKYAFEQLKLRRIALLVDLSSDYSKGLAESFIDSFRKLGGAIAARQFYSRNEEDFGQQLLMIKKTKSQALYIPGYYLQVSEIARELRANRITTTLLGGDGWDSPSLFEAGTSALNNAFITNNFSISIPDEKVKAFSAKYKKTYNLDPDSFAALGYDSAYLLADAIRRANSIDKDKIRKALAETNDLPGVTGRITFDSKRNPKKAIYILKIQNSNFIYDSTIQL